MKRKRQTEREGERAGGKGEDEKMEVTKMIVSLMCDDGCCQSRTSLWSLESHFQCYTDKQMDVRQADF
jgi:hypothetical protein